MYRLLIISHKNIASVIYQISIDWRINNLDKVAIENFFREILSRSFSYLRIIWWRIRVRHGIQRIWDLFLHFYRRSVSSSLCTTGRLIVLIRRHGIELRAARTKARKGRDSHYTVGFLVGVMVARCKIWDIYYSHFVTRIWNSRQFNGEEFPFVCEIAIHVRDISF